MQYLLSAADIHYNAEPASRGPAERSVDLSLHCLNRFTGGIESENEWRLAVVSEYSRPLDLASSTPKECAQVPLPKREDSPVGACPAGDSFSQS